MKKNSRKPEKGYARIFINVGKMDGANPSTLMGFINENVKGKVPVGRIDLLKSFSFFSKFPMNMRRKWLILLEVCT